MAFEALGEDVLLRILSFCDISTVLAVSTVKKPLRRIALSKQLWLSLVLDATFQLIDVVKNAVAGPGSAWDENGQSPSVITTSFEVPLDDFSLDMGFGFAQAHILPGGRYILIHSTTQQNLCIYDVWSSCRVWRSSVRAQTRWQVDLVPGDAIARVVVAQLAVLPNGNTVLRITPSGIVGDFLLCAVLHSYSHFNDPTLVLVNWRASTFASLGRVGPDVQLLHGHILWTYRVHSGPPHQHFLAFRALEAFSVQWQRLTEDNLAARLAGSVPSPTNMIQTITMQARLEYSGRPLEPHIVTATRDALHAGGYNIFVHGFQFPEPPRRTLMERIRYLTSITARRERVSPQPGQGLLWYKFTPGQEQAGGNLRVVSA
ncbi:hypothetical protein C8R45DRAFT_1220725 [Mycena sanguinolenta]|nr:hypothetical protein C8R45DRAFT_1220725 [Mycena sanguinolenta]